eukprot:GHRR01004575.1.p1 GENE.GHRR01004575.1~~GHRR01004575.1.p1  ORF type:complete len:397 (+),score=111.79 GHRR01004575.1:173-1363(+)
MKRATVVDVDTYTRKRNDFSGGVGRAPNSKVRLTDNLCEKRSTSETAAEAPSLAMQGGLGSRLNGKVGVLTRSKSKGLSEPRSDGLQHQLPVTSDQSLVGTHGVSVLPFTHIPTGDSSALQAPSSLGLQLKTARQQARQQLVRVKGDAPQSRTAVKAFSNAQLQAVADAAVSNQVGGQLQQALSDDLQNLVDVGAKVKRAAALRTGSTSHGPSGEPAMQAAVQALAAAGADLASVVVTNTASVHSVSGEQSGSQQSGYNAADAITLGAAQPQPGTLGILDSPVPALPSPAPASSISKQSSSSQRRVRFLAGPLQPGVHCNSTSDGHPATEGAGAVPVRRIAPLYTGTLTKGNVLMLEQLLGPEHAMSVARLKRRVGLLPAIKCLRPHVSNQQDAAS